MDRPELQADPMRSVTIDEARGPSGPRAFVWLIVGVVVLTLALRAIGRELEGHTIHDLARAIRAIPARQVLMSLGFVVVSYGVLTVMDLLGVRATGGRVSPGRLTATAFVAHALGHTAGFSAFTGGVARLRGYRGAGLSLPQVAHVIVFVSAGFALGSLALTGVALLMRPTEIAAALGIADGLVRSVGALLLAALAGAFLLLPPRTHERRLWGRTLLLPGRKEGIIALAVSAADLLAAAASLYVLLPAGEKPPPLDFLPVYLLSLFSGLVSTVPGGAGVFEMVLLHLSPQIAADRLLAALLVYRVNYYLLPLGLAFAVVALSGTLGRPRSFTRQASAALASFEPVIPPAAAITTFLLGAWLLATGTLPRSLAPLASNWLPAAEVSHLLASVTGALLLVVADALQRRNRGACYLAIGLLSLGAGLLALRAQWTQATVLGAGALLMVAARGAFYRPAALSDEPWSWRWIVSVGLAVVATVWLLLFVHKHVEYRNELWWRFALDADAPRALRATLGAVLVLLGFAFWRLMRPARHRVPLPAETQIDSLVPLVEAAPDVQANLVLTGDKAVLQIPGTEGFVMYQRRGRTLVAMGDPVGPPESRERLRWAFRELADREGLLCAFYEIGRGDLEGYLDLGLTLVKLGEEAVVPLDGFSLEGKARAPLRQARNRGIRQGLEFRVVPPEEVPDLLDVLERISQSWLSTKGSAEKGFSLGFFSRSYLRRTAIALVTRHGEPLAFANLWFANRGRAASVDLMRHDFEAPPGVMDYLFVELLSWARSHGCETFSLGMAPLSGLATHRLASRWQRLLGFAAARGDNVYNFAGLRHFKAKFGPRWQARYLAASGGHRMAVVLLDVTRLIAAPPLPAAGAGHAVRDAPAIQSRVAATAGRP